MGGVRGWLRVAVGVANFIDNIDEFKRKERAFWIERFIGCGRHVHDMSRHVHDMSEKCDGI